jgi:hypothetical protein
MLIDYRRRRDMSSKGARLSLNDLLNRARIEWHGIRVGSPDWSDCSHCLAVTFQRPNARYASHGAERVLGTSRLSGAAVTQRTPMAALHRHVS